MVPPPASVEGVREERKRGGGKGDGGVAPPLPPPPLPPSPLFLPPGDDINPWGGVTAAQAQAPSEGCSITHNMLLLEIPKIRLDGGLFDDDDEEEEEEEEDDDEEEEEDDDDDEEDGASLWAMMEMSMPLALTMNTEEG